jgi:hypothetical protein
LRVDTAVYTVVDHRDPALNGRVNEVIQREHGCRRSGPQSDGTDTPSSAGNLNQKMNSAPNWKSNAP